MTQNYRIEALSNTFIVIDNFDETLGVYENMEHASQGCESFKKEDAMYQRAKALVDFAIISHMKMFGVGSDTARYWIQSACKNKT
jgi:hypothetical protein